MKEVRETEKNGAQACQTKGPGGGPVMLGAILLWLSVVMKGSHVVYLIDDSQGEEGSDDSFTTDAVMEPFHP